MKKIILAAIILGASVLTSCKKESDVKPVAPANVLMGFKKDISTAD